MKVAIVGSRDFDWTPTKKNEYTKGKRMFIEMLVASLGHEDYVVSGGANGVDTWAEHYAMRHDVSRIIHEADWGKHGKAAGPIRNALIVRDADILFAFYTDRATSRGTNNCVSQAKRKNIPVFEFDAKTGRWEYFEDGHMHIMQPGPVDFKAELEYQRKRVIESTAQRQ